MKQNREYDVVVVGAGSAGFTTAISSARQGVRVALIEKELMPGGILTVGGNNSIDQFNNPYRKSKKMIIKGIGWEFCCRLQKDGYAEIPDMNAPKMHHAQYAVKVNPVAAAKVMDDMLLENGVTLFYGQPVVSVIKEDKKIKAVIISTKNGLEQINGKIFVDCTGDGDLSYWSGAQYEAGYNGVFQPGTLRYYPATKMKIKFSTVGIMKIIF